VAPDTFLGGGLQTCRKLIDDGWIGEPVAATAFMLSHGPESWHPDPEFYYKAGGGPMYDMGPYYLTALVQLLGPVSRITGTTRVTFPERRITAAEKYGEIVSVDVPTHVAGILSFESGAIATLVTSFDVWAARVPRIEIYGTEGSLSVPDPNGFGGTISLKRAGHEDWMNVPNSHGFTENSRGIGVYDIAAGVAEGRPHRANGELGRHVLECMSGVHVSAETGRVYTLESRAERPEALAREFR
jgi:predicted dehydrogenase